MSRIESIKIKEVVRYSGHNLNANGAVNLTLKAMYDQLTKSIELMQLLNNDIDIKAKIPGRPAMKLGIFRVKQINVDGDGESILKFNGLNDYIEMDNLNILPLNNDENKEFTILMQSDVEYEDERDEEEGEEEEDDG